MYFFHLVKGRERNAMIFYPEWCGFDSLITDEQL